MDDAAKENVIIFPDREALAREAGLLVQEAVQRAVSRNGRCALALSGGRTPRAVYAQLAEEPFRSRIPWKKVHLFWGDERAVPPEHADSNYRMAKEALLEHIQIPRQNIHRIPGELPAVEAARVYQKELQAFWGAAPPRFDILLLGLGTDGHTASLFPGTPAAGEKKKWVTAVFVPRLNAWRITITLPVINQAREILFLVTGSRKAEIVWRLLRRKHALHRLPASRVKPESGLLRWLLDEQAARKLRKAETRPPDF